MDFMTEFKEKQAELRAQIKVAQEELLQISKGGLAQVCRQLFEENPRLKSFSWNQYTPYFNDGEECVFEANYRYLEVNGFDEYGEYQPRDDQEHNSLNIFKNIDSKNEGDWRNPKIVFKPKDDSEETKQDAQTLQNIFDLLKSFENREYKDMFGDHVTVTVTREGVQTEYCDHD